MTPRADPAVLLTPSARRVLAVLAAGGVEARLVGGSVRDTLLGRPVGDRDVAAAAPPETVLARLRAAGIDCRVFGLRFGTVMALPAEGGCLEVTSLRRDMESDGRWPVVRFGTDWHADASRRDFTMNALYADAAGRVFDPLGGLPDLLAGRVRFIGCPADRLREDHLRILRFFRFHASYGSGPPDPAGLAATAAAAAGLDRLARERVGWEMRRLLAAAAPSGAILAARQAGVLDRVLPGADASALARLEVQERRFRRPPAWLRRLLLLAAGTVADAETAWPFSRAEQRGLRARFAALASPAGPEEAGHRWGSEVAGDALLVRSARAGGEMAADAFRRLHRGAAATLPVSPRDLLAAGVPAGPEIGRALCRLRRHWLDRDLRPGRGELLALLREGPG